ncbi:CinA family protein [Microbacterium oryzae]|uniref:CinA family protein n=1 Tax=Microbacterium oryzae TaxID=743009 RepID=A0A6I6E6L4_9MICO|nr:CinA family protein [Microbacterium oryzae]QGU27311.1 CinA family protein [Microbacterium oryzae]
MSDIERETLAVANELLRRLSARNWSIGTAESLTGGLLASAIIDVPGSSQRMRGGVVAYDTTIKQTVLGVDEDLLAAEGAVHPDVARQMALGVRRVLSLADEETLVGLATTGIAGPVSPDGQPVGTVHVAVATPDRLVVSSHLFDGDRAEIRAQSVLAALDLAVAEI